jgi:ABC-type polar amino acid transport system ATPase subunit
VLKGITTIHRGEVVCVIGPSGSGKSTFLRCLNLLEQPTSGQVFIDGVEVTDPTATSTTCAPTWAWSSSSSTSSRT